MNECIFCSCPLLESEETLTQKGVEGILEACEEKGEHLNVIVGQSVHVECRKDYTNKKAIFYINTGCSQINQARHQGYKADKRYLSCNFNL
jgi:hypothetical protein